jgi:hypothetical protein
VGRFLSYVRRYPKTLGGYTASAVRPPIYRGRWWSEEKKRWIPDRIVVCIIDYLLREEATEQDIVTKLGTCIDQSYREAAPDEKEAQASIWIIGYPVIQYVFPNRSPKANQLK